MKKHLIVNYSRTGNNKYLAERTAEALNSDIAHIKPRIPGIVPLLIASATGISMGNKKIKKDFHSYDSVILCGPIWMGQLITPLKDFLNKQGKEIQKLHFITSCSSTDNKKEEKYGYAHVFRKVEEIMNVKTGILRAFPIELVLEDSLKEDDQAMIKTRLSDDNFTGEIKSRFDDFIASVK